MLKTKISTSVPLTIISFILISFLFFGCAGNKKNTPATQQQTVSESPKSEISLFPFANNGDVEKVSELLENGANANEKDEDSRTALMYASYNGHKNMAEELIKHNANVNLLDANGRSALMFAASGPFPETVKLLLENGSEIDIQDSEEHFTALMFAAAEGQLENVKILVEQGANASLKDIDGDDAQTFAQNNGHEAVVAYLKNKK